MSSAEGPGTGGAGDGRTPGDWLSAGWAVLLPVLVLGPALLPGFVLRADMVWVPDLAVGPQTWGLGSALPRAVPSDAVVGLLDNLVPGQWLQKLVLLGTLVVGALGVRALVPRASVVGRLVAVTCWVWNPFVAERLLMGHWPVLVGAAVLPWLVVWTRLPAKARLARYAVALPIGSLSAGAGVVSAVVALLAGWRSSTVRQRAALLVVVAAANAPWLVAGLAHGSGAESSALGGEVFATRAWGQLPVWLQVIDLGGIWNADAVLDPRRGLAATLSVLGVVVLGLLGRRTFAAWTTPAARTALVGSACVGWGLALLSGLLPETVGALAQHVPGGGLLRDGSRFLALAAPLVVLAVAAGADRVARTAPGTAARAGLGVALVLAPVAALPDLAWGAGGRLEAVEYPGEFSEAAKALAADRAAGADGDLLLMPFSSYRAPGWNGGRKVIDPAGRYLTSDFVTNDALVVSGAEVPGEDPRARAVLSALGLPTGKERAAALRDLGISHVVRTSGPDVDRIEGAKAADVPGEVLVDSGTLQLVALRGEVTPWAVPHGWRRGVTGAAWAAYGALLVAGAAGWSRLGTGNRRGRTQMCKRLLHFRTGEGGTPL
ncbi:MAG: hypothetical protein ACI379_02925 [Nocardioides sp.]|uniref:hypothetical protein n=1 Tax=Nocardioides sp. TaxID=35761 RepID=UPI003EFD4A57